MKKLFTWIVAACMSLSMAGVFADDMKKDGMMKPDGMDKPAKEMGKDGMKKPHKNEMMKQGEMGKGEMKKDEMGKGEMKKDEMMRK